MNVPLKTKNRLMGLLYSVIGGVIVVIASFLFTSSYSEKKETNKEIIDELNRLESEKADYGYVDKKVKESTKSCNDLYNEVNHRLDRMEGKIDNTNDKINDVYKVIIENR